MCCTLKKLMLLVCLYAVTHGVQAQAPVQRTIRGVPPRPIKQIKPAIKRDYNWYMADMQRRYPEFARRINASLVAGRPRSIRPMGFSRNPNASLGNITKSFRDRMQQRYPQLRQQYAMRRMSLQPAHTYQQVAATQRELARKRMAYLQSGELK
jgi:hypothetical protein